ncbi:DoxX family protein [Rhizosaccharibacter radicis]|uniref:DoxX family protein n=1 Tax=Rhizosaccharibacter radicis TaxID=2782605 RepID=A0ABT1VYY2_9PROT|nr:DoxX family protein [Acetobacteraceae bacterium KSS12]
MTGLSFIAALAVRYLLVVLFFPFSALDKILNFNGAVGQAQEIVSSRPAATILLMAGLATEILMPLAILTGWWDRLAALVMAGYCMVTALLWKRFWQPGDFWSGGKSKGRELFWDFLKNFSLAGGFLVITLGTGSLQSFLDDPLSSSHPYRTATVGGAPVAPDASTGTAP